LWESKRLLVLADVGCAGRDATLEANLQRLAVSAPQVAVRVLGGGGEDVAAALAESDALLICGGRNLLGEPVQAIAEAARRRIPVVTGGQTIGPELSEAEREALSRALPTVAAVGVRDVPSAIMAGKLGVAGERIFYQVDDAFGLPGVRPRDAALVRAAAAPFVAVTLDAMFVGPCLRRIGSQLAAVARETGLRVMLISQAEPLEATARSRRCWRISSPVRASKRRWCPCCRRPS
jgi:polysaccharide pyruvyl transferase WcaK-like protein